MRPWCSRDPAPWAASHCPCIGAAIAARLTIESIAETLRGGLSLDLSGFGFWSHDIGGFEHTAPADVYTRWCAFGLLSSHSRLNGSKSYRVPGLFDNEAVEVVLPFTEWKSRLMPSLFDAAQQAVEHGTPMLRAMLLEFPDDSARDQLDRQYLPGDALLVAPVFNAIGDVDFWLPEGRWTHIFTSKTVAGSRWLRERHGSLSLPVYVRRIRCSRSGLRINARMTTTRRAANCICSNSPMARVRRSSCAMRAAWRSRRASPASSCSCPQATARLRCTRKPKR
ncbi:MAG: TIM-barrel domain-containing protein [Paraburkholderia tropica]|uniref:TIM-barrel domain-containing protein n=1 Tax=Paraburkholderia tropica TaxID=92647 RepID=UPI001C64D500|nr:TIM-barrel domain-containing protein [Paraburkholderia tropica]MDE1138487.1 glycoside hydrolase family 31 protein [Paraburkholderia tropica]